MGDDMKLPTFLYIGAAKTGSTWIFKALEAHPEIYVPATKEIYFFNRHYQKGLPWYASFFSDANDEQIALGELTPTYLYSRETAEYISRDLPNTRLLACLRDPISRVVSAYQFRKRNGIAGSDFFDTMKKYPEILENSKYSEYVEMYSDIFGSKNFKVFLFDDLKKDPVLFGKEIYKFIGVNADFEYVDAKKRVLSASQPRSTLLAALVYHMSMIAHKLGWLNLIGQVRNSFISRLLYKPVGKEKLSDEENAWLKDYYKEDVDKLEKLLGRNLQHWLQ